MLLYWWLCRHAHLLYLAFPKQENGKCGHQLVSCKWSFLEFQFCNQFSLCIVNTIKINPSRILCPCFKSTVNTLKPYVIEHIHFEWRSTCRKFFFIVWRKYVENWFAHNELCKGYMHRIFLDRNKHLVLPKTPEYIDFDNTAIYFKLFHTQASSYKMLYPYFSHFFVLLYIFIHIRL